MIVVTGAAGFIGSCLVSELNREGQEDIIISDDFSNEEKNKNLDGKKYAQKVHRNDLAAFIEANSGKIEFIFHIGARTDTTLFDVETFNKLNLNYTKQIWNLCTRQNIPLVYASSAATYGLGEFGYDDEDESIIPKLKPLNPYGDSKNDFDIWALQQKQTPPHWQGFKFFNVYGPNEYHKGRMASVILHAYRQYLRNGEVKLFRSHKDGIADGEQKRDFIYVKDVVDVMIFLMQNPQVNGIFNVGTGRACTWNELANALFKAVGLKSNIEYVEMPEILQSRYQYFTQADMHKLRAAGYTTPFTSLEDSVADYCQYLKNQSIL